MIAMASELAEPIQRASGARLAVATDGDFISLEGGLPIFIEGHLVGAIGVGSGTGEEDLIVARAAIAAIEGASETQ